MLEPMARAGQQVWVVALPNTGPLNIAHAWEVLAHTNDVLGRSAYELSLLGPRGPLLRTAHGLGLVGLRPLPRAPRRLPDIAIVAGAPRAKPDAQLQTELAA